MVFLPVSTQDLAIRLNLVSGGSIARTPNFVQSSAMCYCFFTMKQTSLPKTWIFFFIVIVVLIVGAMLESSVEKSSSTPVHASETTILKTERQKNADGMIADGGNGVYVEDQKAGETSVQIGFVVFADSGFVAIHEDNHGVPGKIIGFSDLIHKRLDHLTIQVSSPLQNNHVYYAILHRDNGDGKFSEANDGFLNDKNNDVTLMSFLATE